MGAELVGLVLQIIGVTTGVLALLDWGLTTKQKTTIRGWAETAWLWLSDQKRGGYLDLIVSERTQRVIALVLGSFLLVVIAVLALSYSETESNDPEFARVIIFYLIPLYASSFGYVVLFHSKVTKKLVAGANFEEFGHRLLRLTGLLSIAAIALSLLIMSMLPIAESPDGIVEIAPMAMIPVSVVFAPVLIYFFLYGIWSFWFYLISLLIIFYRAAQFVMLRIASYEKGPVLGLSAVFFAVGLIIAPLARQ